ncbi:hypothetical protein [Dokdonella immobilis]|uniref:Uncharacterized protein n=1 Tax=Dokdonella immobilis TaxID=578942 RepID=A0A1I4XYV5_9GAMM|nr:hypothetical protein [Dokdonella immobilis]SFN31014.1 hypothetical protein SAMN05216289_11355 [Dokdonella immobilis]
MKNIDYTLGCIYTNVFADLWVWMADDLRRRGLSQENARQSPNIPEAWDLCRQLAAQSVGGIFETTKDSMRFEFPGTDEVAPFFYIAKIVSDATIHGKHVPFLALRLCDGYQSETEPEAFEFRDSARFLKGPQAESQH